MELFVPKSPYKRFMVQSATYQMDMGLSNGIRAVDDREEMLESIREMKKMLEESINKMSLLTERNKEREEKMAEIIASWKKNRHSNVGKRDEDGQDSSYTPQLLPSSQSGWEAKRGEKVTPQLLLSSPSRFPPPPPLSPLSALETEARNEGRMELVSKSGEKMSFSKHFTLKKRFHSTIPENVSHGNNNSPTPPPSPPLLPPPPSPPLSPPSLGLEKRNEVAIQIIASQIQGVRKLEMAIIVAGGSLEGIDLMWYECGCRKRPIRDWEELKGLIHRQEFRSPNVGAERRFTWSE